MEPAGRKLLPRIQLSILNEQAPTARSLEPIRDGNHVHFHAGDGRQSQWQTATGEETGQKRKRQRLDDHQHQSRLTAQPLPSVQHLLTAGHQDPTALASPNSHARLIRASNDTYIHEGAFRFLSQPPTQRAFPVSILEDSRSLSFAAVEPDLLDIFRHAWNLRQYIRLKRTRGESWLDHIFFNDCFGVENALYTWTSRYEPGTAQYPASHLYKHCLWLLFNRSVQASQAARGYAQVVEDGLHHVRGIENALDASGDRSILLLPLFLLGASAFHVDQRRVIWDMLGRVEPSCTDQSVTHAAKSLERIWSMMDDGNIAATWEWEKYHALEHIGMVRDTSLVDLLIDPLAPLPPTARLRSPEVDPARFKAGPAEQEQRSYNPNATTVPVGPARQANDRMPSARKDSPLRHVYVASEDVTNERKSNHISNGHPNTGSEITAPHKPFATPSAPTQPAPPSTSPPSSHFHGSNKTDNNDDSIQVLHRRPTTINNNNKYKSSIPPCTFCGKELKNPSDAQKHALQHTKPFHCHEAHCTRVQGFATENDLQRHRKSVHGASPRIGNKIGYVCAACPDPSGEGGSRKWWPRLDNFKAHVRRKHPEREEEGLIAVSASASRPSGSEGSYSYSDGSQYRSSSSTSLRWSEHHREVRVQSHSHQTSAHEAAYPHLHSRSYSGEKANYDTTLRESPENEDHDDEMESRLENPGHLNGDNAHAAQRDGEDSDGVGNGETIDHDGHERKGTANSSEEAGDQGGENAKAEANGSHSDAMDVEPRDGNNLERD